MKNPIATVPEGSPSVLPVPVQYSSVLLLAYRFLALPLLHSPHPFFLPLLSNCFTLYYFFINHD